MELKMTLVVDLFQGWSQFTAYLCIQVFCNVTVKLLPLRGGVYVSSFGSGLNLVFYLSGLIVYETDRVLQGAFMCFCCSLEPCLCHAYKSSLACCRRRQHMEQSPLALTMANLDQPTTSKPPNVRTHPGLAEHFQLTHS